jgi:hypothetical protein
MRLEIFAMTLLREIFARRSPPAPSPARESLDILNAIIVHYRRADVRARPRKQSDDPERGLRKADRPAGVRGPRD